MVSSAHGRKTAVSLHSSLPGGKLAFVDAAVSSNNCNRLECLDFFLTYFWGYSRVALGSLICNDWVATKLYPWRGANAEICCKKKHAIELECLQPFLPVWGATVLIGYDLAVYALFNKSRCLRGTCLFTYIPMGLIRDPQVSNEKFRKSVIKMFLTA